MAYQKLRQDEQGRWIYQDPQTGHVAYEEQIPANQIDQTVPPAGQTMDTATSQGAPAGTVAPVDSSVDPNTSVGAPSGSVGEVYGSTGADTGMSTGAAGGQPTGTNWGGLASTGISAASKFFGGGSSGGGGASRSTPSESSQRGSNAMSGAATGAAVGTAVAPGIGTAIGAGVGAIGGAIQPTGDKSKTEKYNEQLLATKLDMTRMAYRNRGGDEVVGFIAEEKARGLRYRPFVVMTKARYSLGRELTEEEKKAIMVGGYPTISQTAANDVAYTQKQQQQRATTNTVAQGVAMAFLTAFGLRLGERLFLGA